MKIVKKEVETYRDQDNHNSPIYMNSVVSRNEDGPEILGWMRKMAKIKAFGLYEMPKWHGKMLARFIDMDIIKNADKVVTYVVMPDGLKRNYIWIGTPNFQNDGSCGLMGALDEASLQRNILKYKDGKRADDDGRLAIAKFLDRFIDYKNQGGRQGNNNPIELVLNSLGKDLNMKLPTNATLEQIESFCTILVKSNPELYKKPYSDEFPTYRGFPVEWYDDTYKGKDGKSKTIRRWKYNNKISPAYKTF